MEAAEYFITFQAYIWDLGHMPMKDLYAQKYTF